MTGWHVFVLCFFLWNFYRKLSQIHAGVNLAFFRPDGRSFSEVFKRKHSTVLLSNFLLLDKPWSQVPSLLPPGPLPSTFIAHRVQQSLCLSIFHRVLLTPAIALFRESICAQEN